MTELMEAKRKAEKEIDIILTGLVENFGLQESEVSVSISSYHYVEPHTPAILKSRITIKING